MEKNLTTERNGTVQPLPEPRILTEEERAQTAAGLAAAVNGIVGRGCPTCGIGALGPHAV